MRESARSPAGSVGYANGAFGNALIFAGIGIVAASAGLVGYYLLDQRSRERVAAANVTDAPPSDPKRSQEPAAAPPSSQPPPSAKDSAVLDKPVTLTIAGKQVATTWKALGAVSAQAIDRQKGLEAMVALKDEHDKDAVDARVDLDNKVVIPEVRGFGLHVYESLAVLEDALRAGKTEVALLGAEVEPTVTKAKLRDLDISNVMGYFETNFPPGEGDRNHNLRLASSKANGHIIMPGETFSFNEVVGDRTEKQGYRVAHVITAGEMVDGLAGGACQVSSTLHGAAWFAGLDMIVSRPHSRPSAYVTMGMDATVVYPTTDLVMKNPYDFPVVINYIVSQGKMRVEILGKKRPWDKVAFEREIIKEIPYETVSREDDTMPMGTTIVDQVGFPGYKLQRRRAFFKDGKQEKTEKWLVDYPPTTEYVRIGTNPDPNITAPKQKDLHGPMHPGGKTYRMVQ